MSGRAHTPTGEVRTDGVAGPPTPLIGTFPAGGPATPPESFEQDPTDVSPQTRFHAEHETPTHLEGPPPEAAPAIPFARGAERSEPIRVISMKDQTEGQKRESEELHVPLHVQLRSIADVRRRQDTPVGLGHLAPPRDPREVRARRMRANAAWAFLAVALAGAIAFAIWLIAGR